MEAALEGGLSCWQVVCDGATVGKHDHSGAEAFGHLSSELRVFPGLIVDAT